MGKRGDRAANAGPAKKFAKRSNEASRSSQESLVRRRVIAQKTRITRALQRATSALAQIAVHVDAVESYKDSAPEDEMAETLRLEHLRKLHLLSSDESLSEEEQTSAKAHRVDLILSLLDCGDAAEAAETLEKFDDMTPREVTPLSFSHALIAFVNWRGGEEPIGGDEDACELKAREALDKALKSNPYVGVFLAHLPIFMEEVDPAAAREALRMKPTNPAATTEENNDNEPYGEFEGSLEEAMGYASRAAGCWIDFLEQGIHYWVADRLSEMELEWPPRHCCKESKKLLQMFMRASKKAEEEEEEEEEEEVGEKEEEGEEEGEGG